MPMSTAGYAGLAAGEDWHYVGEAGEPAFTNSWTNAGTGLPKLAFRIREAGVVDVQGVVVGGATTSSIFTLPEGYRPTAESYLPAESHDLGGQHGAYLIVGTDGTFVAVFPAGGTIVVYAQVFLNPPAVA